MPKPGIDTKRCQNCRYWFDRCCHALALLDGDDQAPRQCHHFTTEALHLFMDMETRSCATSP